MYQGTPRSAAIAGEHSSVVNIQVVLGIVGERDRSQDRSQEALKRAEVEAVPFCRGRHFAFLADPGHAIAKIANIGHILCHYFANPVHKAMLASGKYAACNGQAPLKIVQPYVHQIHLMHE